MQQQTTFKIQIVELLNDHRIMTVATNRPDGWPQATIVGYVNEGLAIYAMIGRASQKYANIARDPRVSIAIGKDVPDPNAISGLSMAARAEVVTDPAQIERLVPLIFQRYPEYKAFTGMIEAGIVSILDYSKGFAHTDLVELTREDLK